MAVYFTCAVIMFSKSVVDNAKYMQIVARIIAIFQTVPVELPLIVAEICQF
jgi:hypothetical protein